MAMFDRFVPVPTWATPPRPYTRFGKLSANVAPEALNQTVPMFAMLSPMTDRFVLRAPMPEAPVFIVSNRDMEWLLSKSGGSDEVGGRDYLVSPSSPAVRLRM